MNSPRLCAILLGLCLCMAYAAQSVPEWVDPAIHDALRESMEALAPYTKAEQEERERIRDVLIGDQRGGLDRAAREMLERLRFGALPVIEDALLHPEAEVRRRAMEALVQTAFRREGRFRGNPAEHSCKLFNQAAGLVLLRSAVDPDHGVKSWAAAALGHAWVADRAVRESQRTGHLSDHVRALVVATLKKLRHGHHRAVRTGAARALSMMGMSHEDPLFPFASHGFALSATTLGREIQVGEPVWLMVALGWSGAERLHVNIKQCAVHITGDDGQARTISLPQVGTLPGVDRKRIESERQREFLEPVEAIAEPGAVAKVVPDILTGSDALPQGMYTVVVSMRVIRYESEFVVERPEDDHRLWSRHAGLEFELKAPPFELEIW